MSCISVVINSVMLKNNVEKLGFLGPAHDLVGMNDLCNELQCLMYSVL